MSGHLDTLLHDLRLCSHEELMSYAEALSYAILVDSSRESELALVLRVAQEGGNAVVRGFIPQVPE